MILFKKKSEEGLNEFKCKYCDMKFDDKERLKRHSRKAHSENEDFTPNANPFGGFYVYEFIHTQESTRSQ